MGDIAVSNSYEEARRRRLEDNRKRFEDLGITEITKSLSEIKKSEKSPLPQRRQPLKRNRNDVYSAEPRRSSRARNLVSSYRDDVAVDFPSFRRRTKAKGSWASYLARPLEECRTASYEERAEAVQRAEALEEKLQSNYPTFVKSMGLPSAFCEEHLPKENLDMVLEDEDGNEYEATLLGKRTGLSGGWRAFALEHKLDDGDALVFELVEPARFKFKAIAVIVGLLRPQSSYAWKSEIYIVKAGYEQGGKMQEEKPIKGEEQQTKKAKKAKRQPKQDSEEEGSEKPKKLKKEPAKKQAKVQEGKKPNQHPDDKKGKELTPQTLRRSTRSTRSGDN